jgi:hypothetical protein
VSINCAKGEQPTLDCSVRSREAAKSRIGFSGVSCIVHEARPGGVAQLEALANLSGAPTRSLVTRPHQTAMHSKSQMQYTTTPCLETPREARWGTGREVETRYKIIIATPPFHSK